MSRVLPRHPRESTFLTDEQLDGSSKLFTASTASSAVKHRVRANAVLESLSGDYTAVVDEPYAYLGEIPQAPCSTTYAFVKRFTDICGAAFGLIAFGPIMLVCAILIKWQDGGPIFFRQSRVGERGSEFSIIKFRSMVVNADDFKEDLVDQNTHTDNRTFKILNDPRITPVGRFMRRLSLDEMPQFWNILVGEMSLVGPRPALPSEVELYEPRDLVRLAVRPGLTCIWQVSGRSNLDFQQQRRLDAEYIYRRCTLLDLVLILKTVPAVFKGDGAA